MLYLKPVPHKEAAASLRNKPAVLREVFDMLAPEIKGRAFTVGGLASLDIIANVRDTLATLPEGGDWAEIKDQLVAELEPYLGGGAERRAELLLRLHGFQAYAAANTRALDAMRETFPFRQYISVEDARVRPSHAALNGVVLPADSPFWARHTPPWEWGCRCDVIGLTEEDAEDIRKADKGRHPEKRLFLDDGRRKLLEEQGKLDRGPDAQHDLRTPIERGKPGGYEWEPGSLRLDLDQLAARYQANGESAEWEAFLAAAEIQPLGDGRTVLGWLRETASPPAPAEPEDAPEPAVIAGAVFPDALDALAVVRALGGSTGAKLVRDPATGLQYVMKAGASADHLREEFLADELYRSLGADVPEARIYETKAGPVKLARFIEGRSLAALTGAEREAAERALWKNFHADALLGNTDVVGEQFDNVLVDGGGKVWRIDNGGSLRFRAMGTRKTADRWNEHPFELWSMRDKGINTQTARTFGAASVYDFADGLAALPDDYPDAPAEVAEMLRLRAGHLKRVGRKALEFRADGWAAEYADRVGWHQVNMDKAGLLARLPERLDNAPGTTSVVDENGRKDDHFRTSPGGNPSAPSVAGDTFHGALLDAVKTLNYHGNQGTFGFNAAKIQTAAAVKPILESLAKSPDAVKAAMAKHYLSTAEQIEKAHAAALSKSFVEIPTFTKFTPPPTAGATAPAVKDEESHTTKLAAYMADNGGKWDVVRDWAGAQAGCSWSESAAAYKARLVSLRATAPSKYYWDSGHADAERLYNQKSGAFGKAVYDESHLIHHAFVQETLARVDFRYNDRARRVSRIIRTDAKIVVKGIKPGEEKPVTRGANESGSIFNPFYYKGEETTTQVVPHVRITGLYFLERAPGNSVPLFAGEHENEFTFMTDGVPASYIGHRKSPVLDGGNDSTQWK